MRQDLKPGLCVDCHC